MKSLKKSIILTAAFLFLLGQVCMSQSMQKQHVKVLYVGFDPSLPIPDSLKDNTKLTGSASLERFTSEYKTRMPAFKNYLEKYFTIVKTIDARRYDMKMSAGYDVTIFDEVIQPWKKRVYEKKEDRCEDD